MVLEAGRRGRRVWRFRLDMSSKAQTFKFSVLRYGATWEVAPPC